MSFNDDFALWQQRQLALDPRLAVVGPTVLANHAQNLLSFNADTKVAVANSAGNISYTTATGQALTLKANDYGVAPSPGLQATANVVFFVQSAPTLAPISIPTGTVVGTTGDGITQPAVQFLTTANATIAIGATTTGAPVPVRCTQAGILGNVLAGTILTVSLGQGVGLQVSNATTVNGVSNASGAGTGGVDADTDTTLRAKLAAKTFPLNGIANASANVKAIPGVYDFYLKDPQTGSGFCYYAACQVDGTYPTVAGGVSTASGAPDATQYNLGATLSGLAATVDATLRLYLPVNIIPRLLVAGALATPFLVETISALTINYLTSKANQASVLQPLMTAAIIAFIQGLVHNVVPAQSPMFAAVQAALGSGTLFDFTWTSVGYTPTGGGLTTVAPTSLPQALTSIYRCVSNPTITYNGTFI